MLAALVAASLMVTSHPPNRLARETSPYLLQHARNPVDWFPWGDEAFAEARRRDVPIFLSIGYSTCYWCHVMERESFEDAATAAFLKERMVSIKVDREERPDVDEIFMTACQVFTQLTEGRASGGWPLSVFIDPHSLKPFFVGTYYPPEPAFGRPSFREVVASMSDAWRTRRAEVDEQARRLAEIVAEQLEGQPPFSARPLPAPPAADGRRIVAVPLLRDTIATLMRAVDREHGGFGGAPKFPQPAYLMLLLHAGETRDNATVREVLNAAADAMAIGGLFDQVGGGFHRYCVDATWTVPHFEKMLYDQGQLASVYATLVERSGDAFHAETLRRTGEYLLREMVTPEGLFCSAQDAEVDAREGGSYVWRSEEARAALVAAGRGDLWPCATALYGLDRPANFRDPHHPEAMPTWVLRLPQRPEAIAAKLGLPAEEFAQRRRDLDAILKATRDQRKQPATDDKAIASWNGLAIAGLADAGRVLGEQRFVEAAAKAADAILTSMRTPDGGLLRVRRSGVSRVPAFLEDYAMVARGLLVLGRAEEAMRERRRRQAIELVEAAMTRFRAGDGGFYDTLAGQADLFVRSRAAEDGAVPSGNSTMLHVLLDLHEATGEARWLDEAASSLAALSGRIADHPAAAALAVLAMDRMASLAPDRLPIAQPAVAAADDVVSLTAEPSEVVVGEEPVRLNVVLELPAGVHINANRPGDPALVGLGIELLDGEGVSLAVDYPEGEPYGGGVAPAMVHRGTLRVPVTLRRTGGMAGLPAPEIKLVVTFQPCTERACLAPMRRAVPVTIRAR